MHNTRSVVQSFCNFGQSTTATLPSSVQNFTAGYWEISDKQARFHEISVIAAYRMDIVHCTTTRDLDESNSNMALWFRNGGIMVSPTKPPQWWPISVTHMCTIGLQTVNALRHLYTGVLLSRLRNDWSHLCHSTSAGLCGGGGNSMLTLILTETPVFTPSYRKQRDFLMAEVLQTCWPL